MTKPAEPQLHIGYEEHTVKTKVSHLLYVDDLKLIGKKGHRTQNKKKDASI
jgi:hypothetical protein